MVRVVVFGKVQGVCYRSWTAKQALSRGLSGWVRNRCDGSVEAVFSGFDHQIDRMVESCHEGPPSADVQSVRADNYLGAEKSFGSFTIR